MSRRDWMIAQGAAGSVPRARATNRRLTVQMLF